MGVFVEGNNASVTVFYSSYGTKPMRRKWCGADAKTKAEHFAKEQLQLPNVERVICKSQCVLLKAGDTNVIK